MSALPLHLLAWGSGRLFLSYLLQVYHEVLHIHDVCAIIEFRLVDITSRYNDIGEL